MLICSLEFLSLPHWNMNNMWVDICSVSYCTLSAMSPACIGPELQVITQQPYLTELSLWASCAGLHGACKPTACSLYIKPRLQGGHSCSHGQVTNKAGLAPHHCQATFPDSSLASSSLAKLFKLS